MAGDPFLSDPSKKRKRAKPPGRQGGRPPQEHDSEISSDSDAGSAHERDDNHISSDEEFEQELAADKRRRLAKQYLQNLEDEATGGFDAADEDEDIISRRLQQDVAETKGNMYKFYGERVRRQISLCRPQVTRLGCQGVTGVAVHYPYAYTVLKDMVLVKWRVDQGKPKRVRHVKGHRLRSGAAAKTPTHTPPYHTAPILCVAASPDGKYVVTGGADARLIVWLTETLLCLRAMETRLPVNQLAFRRGLDQLYAACGDLRIRTYSINQLAQLEILYGHQDNITDISALARETCVSVGLRDKLAMFWKIADELRLTFRAGEGKSKPGPDGAPPLADGSLDAVCMLDETHFVTGGDNGNVLLWSLTKKRPLFTERQAHGFEPAKTAQQASAETDPAAAAAQVPQRLPYGITAVYAVPYSDLFVTGLYDGAVRVWQVERENFRAFLLVGTAAVRGCVVRIAGVEEAGHIRLYIATSKEHRMGRWLNVEGRNALVALTFSVA